MAVLKQVRRERVRLSRARDKRHTFASWTLMSGVPIEVVAKAMGHSSTAVTRRYGHLAPDYQRLELRKMSGFLGHSEGTRAAEAAGAPER